LEPLADLQARAREDIQRWLSEVENGLTRGTLSAGMLRQAFAYAEEMVRRAAKVFVERAGNLGAEALMTASDGKKKSVDKLTFGQCVNLLELLDARNLIVPRRKAISRGDRELLSSLTKARNEFAHGSPSLMADGAVLRQALENVRKLSHFAVIEHAAHQNGRPRPA
jgi:hypothetical protein